ncbi:MAG TPA: FecR family protein [Dongiaceae bacterium]|jgi:ferric-dicitrate binding protein FerR (iron transport regulator)|nr:FecR family protein [Dongiaceae bacterium]
MRPLLSLVSGRRAILAFALGAALTLLAGGLFAAGFVGQAVKTLGDVRLTRDGADMTVGPGTALQLGDVIKTGPGARLRLRFVDGSILTLGESTTMSIDIFAIDGTNNSRTVVLTVLNGIVNAAAAKSGESQFDYQIKTANAYSAVRGTKWIVAAPKNTVQGPPAGATSIYVLNGVVELGSGSGQPALVNAGNWSSVDVQGKLGAVQPTTPAMLQPLLDATSDNGGGGAPAPTTAPTPSPAPMQMPSLPFPDQNPNSQRALKNNGGSNNSGGTKTGRGSGGYSN